MNYGMLNFKAQNGKPAIFWSNESAKKQDRKFGYKNRDQRFNLRQYPTDLTTDVDNLLQPAEEPVEEKPKKPAKNFIKRNREQLVRKNKNKENDQTVTLTQEQLNAILASVGKVASGKEDALRISIDGDKHEITVESPGRDGDHKRGRRHREKNKKEEEQSIFSLVDDNKGSRYEEEKSRRHDRSGSGDRYRNRNHSGDRGHHRKHSGDGDHHRKHSGDRDYRNHSNERYRDHSSDRYRKHSSDRYRRDSRERGRRHTPERSRERYRTPSRERRRHSPESRSRERRRYSPEDRSHERRRHSRTPEDRYRRDSLSEGRYRKNTPERDEKKVEKPKVENNPPSPREIAGIPVSLPWKHMTKAERRRLMIAREKVMAEETRKEEEEKRRNFQDLETKLHKNFKKDDYRRDDYHHRRDDDRISDSDRGSSLKTASLVSSVSTTGKLSLGELKRRQWEKERADSSTTGDFQPWGKPGAGAPIRTRSGNVVADYSKRKELLYPFMNHRN